jgi:hypothetical protein
VGTAAGTSTKVHETIVARALCAVVHSMSVQLHRDIARAVAASMIARYAAAVVEPFAVRFAGSNTSVNGSPTATPGNTALSTVPLTVNWIGAASAIPGSNGRRRAVSRVRIFTGLSALGLAEQARRATALCGPRRNQRKGAGHRCPAPSLVPARIPRRGAYRSARPSVARTVVRQCITSSR